MRFQVTSANQKKANKETVQRSEKKNALPVIYMTED